MKYKKIRRIAFLLSILLHLLLLLIFQQSGKINFLRTKPSVPKEAPEERLVFELVETPDDALIEEPSEDTNLASDKSTRARDMRPDELAQSDLPFSEGDLNVKDFPQPEITPQPEQPLPESITDEQEIDEKNPPEDPDPGLNSETENQEKKNTSKPTEALKEQLRKSLTYDNLISSSNDQGGISFNTYNWNFAPYMLAMKRRIESNWHPPFAFTNMGAISGTNLYTFRVTPDGRVVNLKQLSSDAHYSLDQSSSGAISSSSPFMPLPKDFPEDFLEVTIKFSYIINK